jgi:hypothetical protein
MNNKGCAMSEYTNTIKLLNKAFVNNHSIFKNVSNINNYSEYTFDTIGIGGQELHITKECEGSSLTVIHEDKTKQKITFSKDSFIQYQNDLIVLCFDYYDDNNQHVFNDVNVLDAINNNAKNIIAFINNYKIVKLGQFTAI